MLGVIKGEGRCLRDRITCRVSGWRCRGQRKGTWGSLQQPERSRQRAAGGRPARRHDKRRMTFTDPPRGTCPLSNCLPTPLSFFHQISADKKTLGRFCGQLGSPLGNPPGRKEFMSQGNKMLLTFHTDFSNEENGTVMFYRGFLAYYQAVGEWPPCPCSRPPIARGPEKENLGSKEAGSLAFLAFTKRAVSRRGLST